MRLHLIARVAKVIAEMDQLDVSLTTSMSPDIVGVLVGDDINGKSASIYVNGNKAKSEDQVIAVVCHEVAHKVTGSGKHDSGFDKELSEVHRKFEEEGVSTCARLESATKDLNRR